MVYHGQTEENDVLVVEVGVLDVCGSHSPCPLPDVLAGVGGAAGASLGGVPSPGLQTLGRLDQSGGQFVVGVVRHT